MFTTSEYPSPELLDKIPALLVEPKTEPITARWAVVLEVGVYQVDGDTIPEIAWPGVTDRCAELVRDHELLIDVTKIEFTPAPTVRSRIGQEDPMCVADVLAAIDQAEVDGAADAIYRTTDPIAWAGYSVQGCLETNREVRAAREKDPEAYPNYRRDLGDGALALAIVGDLLANGWTPSASKPA